ncbi:MAG: hypothetical protein K2J92_04740 [Muribaculaceae bacterium]|nr:hypothetical protein [Muribaculaceae bacterium]MDE6843682.1 hypothetical protein [Muribaculaceae bacterium]
MASVIADGSVAVVKNIMGVYALGDTGERDSRLDLWENVTGRPAVECAHEICHRPATRAAVAVRAFSTDRTRYLYPACETCARRTEMLYVAGPLVALDN